MATGHTAIVTGANHGIGAATAQALAQRGCAVLCTFLRVDDPDDPGTPQEYRDHRAQDAAAVVGRIRDGGGKAAAVEADLSDPATPGKLFDAAEEQFGPGEPPEPSVQARDAGPRWPRRPDPAHAAAVPAWR